MYTQFKKSPMSEGKVYRDVFIIAIGACLSIVFLALAIYFCFTSFKFHRALSIRHKSRRIKKKQKVTVPEHV
ncbi:hypothetical protein QR680_015768 [Steinernema hermaphroditum]|uniref:Uncharacterized protein n=1 Tax=Steinernema hermaphroditum TaxID=289476 RepID=A0AA39HB19_9BILA|nr:hypothetical protein QR680_015768 [Steinernema hermaphroditum]